MNNTTILVLGIIFFLLFIGGIWFTIVEIKDMGGQTDWKRNSEDSMNVKNRHEK